VAASADYKKGDIVLPYTVAHAQKSGWIWDISLSSRRGTGYVFSSDHISDEDAALALANYIGVPADSISPRFIDMKTGRASRHWVRNCVAIGLSGGFIEPLESTGIMLIELGIRCLMDNWPGFVGQQKVVALQTNYNRYMRDLYEEVLEFIVMHYRLSQRQDTPFWRDSSALETPHRLQERMAVWRHKVPSHFDLPIAPAYVFGLLSYLAVLRGMCWGSDARSVYVDPASLERLEGYLGARQQQWRQSVAGLPGHAAYLLSLRG
jgi:tryptophan halogenase